MFTRCFILTHLTVTAHLQVGVNVNLDASFLERDYGVKVANTVDLRTHARECWVETPSRSLAGMVSALVGKELPKDPTVRLSRWSSPLTHQQVTKDRFVRGTRVRMIRCRLECAVPSWLFASYSTLFDYVVCY